ncbi:MAG: hypothetical protein DYG93_02505 [Leptolyngbya sp. PLA2]|nr:hypothetical protein [Leptolyngbya sp. PL-A2]MCQ3940480.1 hypothetical protein [cyanobacterium CYA1]MCZ7633945.1 hypothetical protein [Phycisphaerales bacterium]MDL1904330.1 hypothetical protein [Synechococcales cyanobacterium CNB]GIK19561.1 MAG: hypothetical protein BroJett004_17250 [Planctomycetota bacterium]
MHFRTVQIAALAVACIASGCASYRPDASVMNEVSRGQYGDARGRIAATLPSSRSDPVYLLARTKAGIVALADGLPEAAEPHLAEVYDLLRTQGLNADKTVPSVVVHEGVRIWKGEPFEQAMGYAYVAVHDMVMADWGNARAAAGDSIFLLRDFGRAGDGRSLTSIELAKRAAERDRDGGDYLSTGYTAVESDFALGYLLAGVANRMLDRPEEAAEHFAKAAAIAPHLVSLASTLEHGDYDMLLIVDTGFGPEKIATGQDGVVAAFVPRERGPASGLVVQQRGRAYTELPPACDLNEMAMDHRWNNLEDVRRVKSLLGSGMMVAGAAVAIGSNDTEAQLAGLGILLAGMAVRAGSKADTRHNELLPRFVYIVPIRASDGPVTLQVAGKPGTRLSLAGLPSPGSGETTTVRYVRLLTDPDGTGFAPAWAASGRILYANDETGALDAPTLPYILGGRCVRTPTPDLLVEYQRAGLPDDVSFGQLLELYRLEGLEPLPGPERRRARGHVLEGGRTVFTPQAGSAAFARLFGQEHPAYAPRSREVRELVARIGAGGKHEE